MTKGVIFGFGGYEMEFPLWSKHHKSLSIHVRRVYADGETILSEDEKVRCIVDENERYLKFVELESSDTGAKRKGIDYYLPLYNLEYEENAVGYYSLASSNAKRTTYIRFKFMIENNLFIMDYDCQSEGSYATPFSEFLSGLNLKSVIEETLDKGGCLEDVGIEKGEDGRCLIAVANGVLFADSLEVEVDQLVASLVAAEIYRYDVEIV